MAMDDEGGYIGVRCPTAPHTCQCCTMSLLSSFSPTSTSLHVFARSLVLSTHAATLGMLWNSVLTFFPPTHSQHHVQVGDDEPPTSDVSAPFHASCNQFLKVQCTLS